MSIVGSWKMSYDWGCDGGYSTVTWTINSNGTFSSSGGSSGKWAQVGGMVLLQYNGITTTYAGNVNGSVMVGAMSTFGTGNGCWYALGPGAAAAATAAPGAAAKGKAQADETGKGS